MREFNELAATYDDWFATPLGSLADRRETQLLMRLLAPRPGERVLDVGCGTAHWLPSVARSGARWTGVEPSTPMLAVAQSRSAFLGADLVRGRAEDLPFSSGVFDGVLCVTVLEFVDDLRRVLTEVARVVTPRGRLVFGVPTLRAPGPGSAANGQTAFGRGPGS